MKLTSGNISQNVYNININPFYSSLNMSEKPIKLNIFDN